MKSVRSEEEYNHQLNLFWQEESFTRIQLTLARAQSSHASHVHNAYPTHLYTTRVKQALETRNVCLVGVNSAPRVFTPGSVENIIYRVRYSPNELRSSVRAFLLWLWLNSFELPLLKRCACHEQRSKSSSSQLGDR